MKKVKLNLVVPFLFLILIWILFFQKFFLKGLLPVPADIITGMYYPWLDYKWGYEVGVPVKNPILSDTISQFWIWRNWAVDQLKQGRIAIWNPYSLAGYPMSPWFHTILFSPANIFYFLTDKLTAMGLIVAFQLLAALLFMFLFLFDLTKSRLASLFGAISFSFSAFFIGWLTWGTVSWTAAFLPLILLLTRKLVRGDGQIKPGYIFGFILSLVCSFLGGHPQTFFYVLLVLLINVVSLSREKGVKNKQISLIVILSALCPLLVLPAILPSIPIIRASIRNLEGYISEVNYGFLSPIKLVVILFAPNFFGNPATGNYWGGGFNFQEYLGWFGTSALLLAIFSFWAYFFRDQEKSKRSDYSTSLSIFLLGILLSLKYPLGFLIYKLRIPLLSTSSASRALFLSIFGGATLAAFAIKNLLEGNVSFKALRNTFYSFLILVGGIGGAIIFSRFLALYLSLPEERIYLTDFIKNLKVAIRNFVLPVFSATGAMAILFLVYLFRKKRFFPRFFVAFLLFLIMLEGFYFGWRYTPFVKRDFYFSETPIIKFLKGKYQSEKDFFRIERENGEILPANMWLAYGFYSASGYEPVYPRSYADFLIESKVLGGYSRYLDLSRAESVLDNLGIKYFLVLKRDEEGRVSENGKIPYWINKENWRVVFEDKSVVALENKSFRPPYLVVDSGGNQLEAKISLLEKGDDFWKFQVEAKEGGLFILKENYFPGWKVKVDEKGEEIRVIDGTFKGVVIPPGRHQIKFWYSNNLFDYFKMALYHK